MIYLFVVFAVLLAAGSVGFLVLPLARVAHPESREEYFQLLTVRDRLLAQLNELDVDEGDRSMEAATAVDERARLEAELAAVLDKLEADAPKRTKKTSALKPLARWVIIGLAAAVPLLATGVYFINVTPPPDDLEEMAALPPGVPPQALKMVKRLEQRLQENPADLEGWLKLGRSYVVLGRVDDARLAYRHAYGLLPKNFEPDSPEASWFLGLAAYDRNEPKRALQFWQKLYGAMPAESEAAKRLKKIMDEARKRSAGK
jgi:cytochrome c-type biogenesis protein CcmH